MQPEGPNNSILAGMKFLVFCGVVACPAFFMMRQFVPGGWFASFYVLCTLLYMIGAVVVGYQSRLMSAEVPMADRNQFVAQVTDVLVKRQWQPAFQVGDTLTFKGSFPMNAIFDAVVIEFRQDMARIVGPRNMVGLALKRIESASPEQIKT